MNIEYYSSLIDKESFFSSPKIDSIGCFDAFLEDFSPKKKGTSPHFFLEE